MNQSPFARWSTPHARRATRWRCIGLFPPSAYGKLMPDGWDRSPGDPLMQLEMVTLWTHVLLPLPWRCRSRSAEANHCERCCPCRGGAGRGPPKQTIARAAATVAVQVAVRRSRPLRDLLPLAEVMAAGGLMAAEGVGGGGGGRGGGGEGWGEGWVGTCTFQRWHSRSGWRMNPSLDRALGGVALQPTSRHIGKCGFVGICPLEIVWKCVSRHHISSGEHPWQKRPAMWGGAGS